MKQNAFIIIIIISQVWWLMPISPATEEAEIRRIKVQGQPRPKKKKVARPHLNK
jgi:hypothetical protein